MEDKQLPPASSVMPDGSSDSLDAADVNTSVASYSLAQKNYPIESLEVHTEGGGTVVNPNGTSSSNPTLKTIPISRRRATLISLAITFLVVLLTGVAVAYVVRKNSAKDSTVERNVPTQGVTLQNPIENTLPVGFGSTEDSLLINGDVITQGVLKVVSGSFVNVLSTQQLTANREFVLPDASGVVCIDINNCGYATNTTTTQQAAQIAALQTQLNQLDVPEAFDGVTALNGQNGSVSIQGSTNRISVSTSNGVITLSTPQDLNANANVQFNSLTVDAGGFISGNTLQQTAAGNDLTLDAGSDSLVFIDGGRTFQLPAGGGATQTICTTQGNCGGGGATPVVLAPGGAQVEATADGSIFINDTGGGNLIQLQSLGVDRLVVANNGNTTVGGTLTVSGLGSGIVRATGGLLSSSAVNLASGDITGTLGVTNGGTGATSLTTNGVLVGNGTSAVTSVAAGGAGLCLISNVGAPSWQACPGSGGVSSVNAMTGAITILGTTNQVNVANGVNTVTLSTPQDIATSSSVQFNSVALTTSVTTPLVTSTGALTVTPGGAMTLGATGQTAVLQGSTTSITSNGVNNDITLTSADQIILNAGSTIELQDNTNITGVLNVSSNADIAGHIALGNNAAPSAVAVVAVSETYSGTNCGTFGCYGMLVQPTASNVTGSNTGIAGVYSSIGIAAGNLDRTAAYTAGNATGAGTVTDNYGLYVEDMTKGSAADYGVYIQGADTYALWVDAGITRLDGALDVQSGTASIGTALQAGTLTLYDGSSNTGALQTTGLSANRTYTLPNGDGTVCLVELGNCAGSGGGVTGSGTNNRVAKFTSTGSTVGDSSISDTGSLVTVNGNVNLEVQGTNVTVGVGSSRTGSLVLRNSTNNNTVTLQSGVTSATYALTLPTAVGSTNQCLKAQDGTGTLFWDNCLGGGGGGGITSLDGQTGPSIAINNATGAANVITIDNAAADGTTKGIAAFNATNFSAASGVVNTIQNIATTSAPTFGGLTLNGTLDVSGLATLTGGLTVQVGDTLTFNGDAFTDLTGNGLQVSSNALTIAVQANKGLEVDGNGLSFIDCVSGEILKYNGSNQWACAADAGASGTGDDVSVNGVAATNVNLLNTAASGTSASTTWGLDTGATPDDITLTIGNASATDAGAVTTGAQTFAGAKTFNGQIVAGAGINLGSQTLQGTTAVINFDNFDVSSGGTITAAGDAVIQGGDLTLGTASQAGSILLHDGDAETITFALPDVSASYVLTLPSAVGGADQCLKAQNGTGTLFWDNCLGGTGGGGITSVDGQTGPSVAINNATGAANVITIDNAAADGTTKGIAAFNATNFSAASGIVNTIQGISTAASPQFVGLTLTGDLQVDGNSTIGSADTDTLTVNAASTFTAATDVVLADLEDLSVGSTITGTNSVSVLNMVVTNNTSSGTQNLALLQNAPGSGVTDGLLVLDNADTNTAVGAGIVVTSQAGGITTGIDVSDSDIGFALLLGDNDINGANFTLTGATGAVTGGTYNGQTISSSANLTGTVDVAGLATLNGGLTVQVGDTFTFNGDAFTDLTGNGLQVTANALTLDATVSGDGLSATTSAGSGLEVLASGLTLLQGCADSDVLKWNETSDTWGCAADAGGSGLGDDISVNGVAATNANLLNAAASGTSASTTWSLNTGSTPDDITLVIGNASATDAGAVTTGVQTFAGAKTFNGQITAGAGIDLGSQTLSGTTAVINFNNFDVSSGGAVTAVGVDAGSGLLQGTGGLTLTGTTSINTTGTANTSIGNATGTLALTSSGLNVTTAGAVSGVTTLAASSDADFTLGDTENVSITNAVTGTNAVDVLSLSLTNQTTSGTQRSLVVTNADHAANATTEALFVLDNAETTANTVTDYLLITKATTGVDTTSDAIDVSDNDLFNAINIGTNFLVASGDSINDFTGNGLQVTANALTLDATVSGDGLSATTSSGSGMEVLASGLTLLQGCADSDVLKWNETTDVWACAVDNGGTNPWETTSGVVNLVTDGDTVTIGSSTAGGKLFVDGDANEVQLQVQANATQTADLFVIESSGGTDHFTVEGDGDAVLAANKSLRLVGGATGSRPGTPAEGMLFYDTTTDRLLAYANGKWQGDRTASTKIVAANNSSQADKDAADYIADGTGDETEINAALIAGAGGQVHLMPGTYIISASVSIPDNTTLMGAGRGTTLELANLDTDIQMIKNTSGDPGTGVVVKDMHLDGRKDLNTAGEQIGVYFIDLGDGSNGSAIQGGRVSGMWIEDFRNEGIFLIRSENCMITNNVVQNGTGGGIKFYRDSMNNTMIGNKVQGNGTKGIFLEWNASYNTISNNVAQSNGEDGIRVFDKSNNNSVTGNVTQANGISGIVFADYVEGGTISGNTSIENTQYGIFLSRLGDETANDYENAAITVTGNTVQGNAVSGIEIYRASDNTVSGNKAHDNGGATTNRGIAFDESDDNNVSGNSITDTSCSSTCYAINVTNSSSADNFLSNNTIETGTINDSGTNTIYAGQVDNNGEYRVGIDLFVEDKLGLGVQTLTLTDDGTANDTLTPTATYVRIDQDETGNGGTPVLAVSETGAKDGDLLIIVNFEIDGSNEDFTINNSATVINLPGAATNTMTTRDVITLIYTSDRWMTVSKSDN